MNTADLTRAQMRDILKARGVKGASSMRRPQCEQLLADVDEAGFTLADMAAGRVPADVLDAPDEGPSAEWESRWHDERTLTVTLAEMEVDRPATRDPKAYIVCGWCEGAPTHRDPDEAHALCRFDWCQCSLLNHRPDDKVRQRQSWFSHMSIERCIERDPGRAVR